MTVRILKGDCRDVLRTLKLKGDPLRGNPLVGFISEGQAEGILAEIREEKRRGVW